ncbi:MAG: PhoD-like phosphatase N-terminal domain-containing protein, partial [Candidatus Binatia bacterium]
MWWTRRKLLTQSAAALALSACRTLPVEPAHAKAAAANVAPEPPARVFPQSIASGDPTPTGAIVWTRLAPETIVAGRALLLEVATDESFRDVPVRERIAAERIRAEDDFVVRE